MYRKIHHITQFKMYTKPHHNITEKRKIQCIKLPPTTTNVTQQSNQQRLCQIFSRTALLQTIQLHN